MRVPLEARSRMRDTTVVSRPTVSVIVPCYNYGHYLPDCVRSVVEQEGVDVRVLIIDDASADGSGEVAKRLADGDARIEMRAHAANQGHIETYNEGLRWADGDYTVLISADDMLTAGSLRRACALLEANPRVGFAYGRCILFGGAGPLPRVRTGAARWKIWPGRRWIEERCRAAENCIHSPEVVVRTAMLRRLGVYRPELPHTADLELWMRLAAYGDVGFVRGPYQAYYRVHPQSLQHRRFSAPLSDLEQIAAAFRIFFRDHGDAVAGGALLEATARRASAKRALLAACRAYDRGAPPLSEVAAFERLAYSIDPDVHREAEQRGLRWRKRLGVRLSSLLWPLLPPSVASRLLRRSRRVVLRRLGM